MVPTFFPSQTSESLTYIYAIYTQHFSQHQPKAAYILFLSFILFSQQSCEVSQAECVIAPRSLHMLLQWFEDLNLGLVGSSL